MLFVCMYVVQECEVLLYESYVIQDVGLKELHSRLHHFLERAYRIKDSFEKDLFEQVSTTAAMDSAVCALQEMDREYEIQKRKSRSYTSLEGSSSDQDSFVSASEVSLNCIAQLSKNQNIF